MKHSKFITVIFSTVLFINFSQAQKKIKLENSILWKVEHVDFKEPSYLFGTIHIMCENEFKIPKKVSEALQNVNALVLEVNLSDPKEMQELQNSMSNPKKISDEISNEQYNELNKLVTKVTGVDLKNYDSYGLSGLNSILISKMLPCTTFKSFENEITLLANKSEKPIFSLEKASEQIEILKNAYPTEFALEQIMLFDSYKKDFNDAILFYNKEEITKTVDLITKEQYMDENATKIMQVDRNKNWVKKMPSMMKERSNLFVIGVGHLTNDYGIIHLLREKGYTVTPVFK